MINQIYQLINPRVFSVKYTDININDQIILRPTHMALCHADQRYYLGLRDARVLKQKLPMALIHECSAKVIFDPTNTYNPGQKVVMIPNSPGEVKKGFYENYGDNVKFLSSGYDGFAREFVNLPIDRVVAYDESIPPHIAAISEFLSVGVHAISRYDAVAHKKRDSIGIWGDGSLGYIMACLIKYMYPEIKIYVFGRNERKMSQFSFVYKTYHTEHIPDDLKIDHAFECAGGEGSAFAIDDIIKHINPQGTAVLMGVSENKVLVNTRDILEKGLTFIGSSRSGRVDFKKVVEILKNKEVQKRLSVIIYLTDKVTSIESLHKAFETDLNTPFKTVFPWEM